LFLFLFLLLFLFCFVLFWFLCNQGKKKLSKSSGKILYACLVSEKTGNNIFLDTLRVTHARIVGQKKMQRSGMTGNLLDSEKWQPWFDI